VYAEGKVYHSRHFVIFYKREDEKKVGVVASKKVGNAVARNRAKRLLRELYRKNQYKIDNAYLVLVARKTIINAKWQELESEFLKVIYRSGLNK
jgi:ribonuclease P protein component